MKRFLSVLSAAALLALLMVAPARADFGLQGLDFSFVGEDDSASTQAGSHPFAMESLLGVNTIEDPVLKVPVPDEDLRDLTIELPPGLVGDPYATPQCTSAEFGVGDPKCPIGSTIGFGTVEISEIGEFEDVRIYNLVPPPGAVAKLGFAVVQVPVTLEVGLSQDPPYNAITRLSGTPQVIPFYASEVRFWGTPADPAHNAERGGPAGAAQRPFLTLPRSCTGPLPFTFRATSWQGSSFEETIETHGDAGEPLGMTGCTKVGFSPGASAQPTNHSAGGPTGLDFNLDIADEGLTNPEGIAQSDVKELVVTLPEGMTLNPSAAEGLGVCSKEDLAKETIDAEPGDGCPQSSKVGTVEAESPLLEGKIIKGSVYVAKPLDNLAKDSLIAFYVVLRDRDLGIVIKQAARVEPDSRTGQLITTTEDMPQLPIGHLRFHFREGGRSPLITPSLCGAYETKAQLTPWANPSTTYTTTSSFSIDSGVGGGACPAAGTPPFEPGLSAGTLSNQAGSYSPFYMRLTRRDGDQDLTKLSSVFPPGLVGKLAGVQKCPEGAVALARSKTGLQEIASPSCPPGSEIGRSLGGAGVGADLTYVPGKLYLGGPVGDNPLSVIAITPAVAGPFDAGTVALRFALNVNPKTAEVELDGANSDPIPHILKGIVLKLRDLRAYVDRPQFILNPTSCARSEIRVTPFGSFANVFDPADDMPVSLATRFQAAGCASLGFRPRLAMRLKGGTERGDHPAFSAVLRPRAGDANFSRIAATLPRSAFLDQAHIRTICTRVQYAADACPKGSVYGHATVHTPLLDEPLSGPVYLRSSNNKLPDMVLSLRGIVDVELVGRVDSHKGGIRTTFEGIPDAPATRAILSLRGGKKGLIVNSRSLCKNRAPATLKMIGQNGRRYNFRPFVQPSGC